METKEIIETLGGQFSNDDGELVAKFYHADFACDYFDFISIDVDLLAVYGSGLDDELLIKLLGVIISDRCFFIVQS